MVGARGKAVDVSRLIDERGVTAFNVGLVIFSFFVILLDGYDISAVSLAAPSLIKAWNITDRAALGPLFSAGLFGILFGSPIFGFVGDRYGRKIAIIGSVLTFGIFTWAGIWSHSVSQLTVLRALAGIGIGGLLPNIIALNAEYAPRRFRATMIILMFCGITFGGAIPGMISAWLVPLYGWQVLFLIGGALPLVLAVLVALFMPESIKYLVLKGGSQEKVARLVGRIDPGASVGPGTVFTVEDEKQYSGFSPTYLFRDGLALITPLLWFCFAMNLMGYYFLQSWISTILHDANVAASHAALANTILQIGGTLGGIGLSRQMDSKGLAPVAFLFALSIPVVGAIGYIGTTTETALMIDIFLAGLCTLGLQFGLNATSAMIYPTSFRSNGSGWAFAIGRFGSIVGPIVGGFLIAAHISLTAIFLWAAVPYVLGTIAALALARLYRARFHGGLGEREAVDEIARTGAR